MNAGMYFAGIDFRILFSKGSVHLGILIRDTALLSKSVINEYSQTSYKKLLLIQVESALM